MEAVIEFKHPFFQLVRNTNKLDRLYQSVGYAVTIYFKGLWQDFVHFLCQTKKNSIDRIKEMVPKFS